MGCPKGIISDVISEPLFGNYGRLIFPADSGYFSGDTLGTLKLTWYSNIDPEKTVETVNRLLNPYTREMSLDDMNIAKAQGYR